MDVTPAIVDALSRLEGAGLVAQLIDSHDIHLLGGRALEVYGGICVYEDSFAIISCPDVGFTVSLNGLGQLDETREMPNLTSAVDAVIAYYSS